MSVILPVYNGQCFVAEAVESILGQSFRDFELVVIDDGSTDQTPAILAGYAKTDSRIKIISHNRNRGFVTALNHGLAHASGKLIARMDHDDIALPSRFEEQVNFLLSHEDTGVVGSTMIVVGPGGETAGAFWTPETHDQIRFGFLFNNQIAHPSVMFRVEIVKRLGLFYQTRYTASEDYDFWVAVTDHVRAYNCRSPLVKYRIHPAQMSGAAVAPQQASAEQISSSLLRVFDPAAAFTWSDRRILNWLYRFYLLRLAESSGGSFEAPPAADIMEAYIAQNPVTAREIATVETFLHHGTLAQMALRYLCVSGSDDVGLKYCASIS